MKKTLSDLIRLAGFRPFAGTYRANKNDKARDMMGARSPFYDADTLRFFRCRVVWCDARMDGVVMVAVFSQSRGFDASQGRESGYVIHDFTGHCLASERGFSNNRAAGKVLTAALAALNPAAIVREALQREQRATVRSKAAITKALRYKVLS